VYREKGLEKEKKGIKRVSIARPGGRQAAHNKKKRERKQETINFRKSQSSGTPSGRGREC